jgi:uncharacterized Fe-S cluster-containing radical SAM superfamily protein
MNGHLDVDLPSPATAPPAAAMGSSAGLGAPATAIETPAGAAGEAPPEVELQALETLWFQVGGTLCNLACSHCFISCSPTNHTHEMMRLEQVRGYLGEAAELGVKEYYFTGGEPFLNPDMEAILAATLAVGPATVLTNGLLLDAARCARLAALAGASRYSLDLRVSLDGYDAASNDTVRGAGSFERVLAGLRNLAAAGLNPVVTVTEACVEAVTDEGKRRFFALLSGLGLSRPRLKVLPLFKIGAEATRGGAYESWQLLRDSDVPAGSAGLQGSSAPPGSLDSLDPQGSSPGSLDSQGALGSQGPPGSLGSSSRWDHLQCSSCRMATDQGVWVCPILVNEPEARMGDTLAEALGTYPLRHSACWTCHVHGVSCRT